MLRNPAMDYATLRKEWEKGTLGPVEAKEAPRPRIGTLAGQTDAAPLYGPDDLAAMPDPAGIKAFRISGPVGIKLHRGTWHAGPFFTAPEMDFLNLELSDTNEADHVNCHLARDHGVSFRFEV